MAGKLLCCKKFDSIANSVATVEPSSPRDFLRVGPIDLITGGRQRCSSCIDVHDESRMSLSGGSEVVLDAYMYLTIGSAHPRHAKPTSSASSQQRRFHDLVPTQRTRVELTLALFAASRTCDLHVVNHRTNVPPSRLTRR